MTHTTKISLENLLQRRLKKLHTKLDRGIHMRSRLEQGARGSCLHLTHGVGSTATARIDPDASHLGHIAAHASTMTVTGVTAGMRVSLARPVHRGVDRRLGRTSDHRGRSARASVKPLHPPPHARVDFRRRVATRGAVETAVSEPETSTSSSAAADDAPVEPKPAAPEVDARVGRRMQRFDARTGAPPAVIGRPPESVSYTHLRAHET